MPTVERTTAHPSFRFLIQIDGIDKAVFSECSLPSIDWDVLEIKEGGQNSYVHLLPGRRTSAKVTLKSGLGKTDLYNWYANCMGDNWVRKDVTVRLLDVSSDPVLTWKLAKAFPTKWSSPTLKSDDSTIAIETLELACAEVTVT